jgi:hypothetical protein
MKPFLLAIAALFLFVPTQGQCGFFRRITHNGLVAASGIRPNQVGTHEGVGMSSRYEDARNNACYWGKRTPVSIQYSRSGGLYYAVVRYR